VSITTPTRAETVAELAAQLRGPVIVPDHAPYQGGVRLANARHVRRPAALARCTGVGDVITAIRFARERDIPFSVLAGGHDADGWGLQDDVLAIDLTLMNGVLVNPRTRRGIVQAGSRLGIMDRETAVHHLAVTGGTVSDTGVAGLTLGGGIGWLTRKYGATVDSLAGIDAVTVNGDVVRASAEENPDLFWAMRGGGGNFAVATSFEFQMHPQDPIILAGSLLHSGGDAVEFLSYWREFMLAAPDELGSMALLMRAVGPQFPADIKDQLIVATIFAYAGDLGQGERVLSPVRSFGTPIRDSIKPTRYTDLQQVFESPLLPQNQRGFENSGFLPDMTDAFINEAVDAMNDSPVPRPGEHNVVVLPISGMGGAFLRFDESSTAMPRGNAQFYWEAISSHAREEDDATWIGFVEHTLVPRLRALSGPQTYLNHNNVRPDDQAFVEWAYGPEKYARLVELKDMWDPSNVLRYNTNIKPSSPKASE
jgi:FAD/FMN-containing dehydrogenase